MQINSGADNPAGLIAGLKLQQEQTGIQTAINNASLAGNVIGTAEGGLNEVSSLLTQLQSLVGAAANTGGISPPPKSSADQLAGGLDSQRPSTVFFTVHAPSKAVSLLNGNLGLHHQQRHRPADITNLQVNKRDSSRRRSTAAVAVQVVSSAKTAAKLLTYTGGTISGNTVTLQVGLGNLGSTQLSFASGTTVSSIATAINGVEGTRPASPLRSARTDLRVNSHAIWFTPVCQHRSGDRLPEADLRGLSNTKASGADAAVTINGAACGAGQRSDCQLP